MKYLDPITRLLYRRSPPRGAVMLMYHAVSAGARRPDWPWAVSQHRFREQLEFLASQGYATPTLHELVAEPERWSGRTAVITFDDGYADNLTAYEELRAHGMRASWFIVTGSIGQPPRWQDTGYPAGRLLDADALRTLHATGMEIGSHTVSHLRLPQLVDTALRRELSDSKSMLEDLLGAQVNSFAYPYGAWDARCANATQEAGYTAACTTRTGWALRDRDPFSLRRLTIYNTDSLSVFARKLCYAANAVDWPTLIRQNFVSRFTRTT